MPKKYDVVAITGNYQKDGQEKASYANVGMVIEKDGKFYLKMKHPVTVHDDGHVINFFSLFEPRQQSGQQQSAPVQQGAKPDHFDGGGDDIPW